MVRIESLILEFRLAAAAPLHSEVFWVLFCLVNCQILVNIIIKLIFRNLELQDFLSPMIHTISFFFKLTNLIHFLLRVKARICLNQTKIMK